MATDRVLLEAWVARLEAARDPQTRLSLRDPEGFCCLGVLLDIVDPGAWDQEALEDEAGAVPWIAPDGSSSEDTLPDGVVRLCGLPAGNPRVRNPNWTPGSDYAERISLAEANDELRLTFPQIAALIREEFLQ